MLSLMMFATTYYDMCAKRVRLSLEKTYGKNFVLIHFTFYVLKITKRIRKCEVCA